MGKNKGGRRPSMAVIGAASLATIHGVRNSKLKPELLRDLLMLLNAGATYELACEGAGLSYSALKNWMKDADDKGESSVYFEAVKMIRKARPTLAFKALERIELAAQTGDWKASAWQLTNLFPRDIGPRKAVEVSGPEGSAIQIENIAQQAREELKKDLENMTEEQLQNIVDAGESVCEE